MSFDKPTRNALARMVGLARELLKTDITAQLQTNYRLQSDGTALSLDGLTDDQRVAAEDLRQLLQHFVAALPPSEERNQRDAYTQGYDRLVREIGFTVLNRLAALRLCEERDLVVESVRKGMASDGFKLFDQLSNGALGTRYQTYRAFLESLFDELALDLGALFDRRSPLSHVFPSERAVDDVLKLLNDSALASLWRQDETIGWIYQYYNDETERRKMRDASQAPRNSRELAIRNQFFTPRYVVEFLTDNTLGRIWYELQQGHTRLKDECRYLVRPPNEIFLKKGESPPNSSAGTEANTVPYRAKKDPRHILMLDPAGGSGHFGLYSFDLFEIIYTEAYDDPELGPALQADYPDRATYLRDVPGLILARNIHIIDIDPRAVQIAALALWLRAQRSFQRMGLNANERPSIRRVNVVCAEPMPGERDLLDDLVAHLRPKVLGDLVRVVFDKMQLAGEAGSLLKIEEELREAIATARSQWVRGERAEQLALFGGGAQMNSPEQLVFDVSGISDESFWAEAEERVFEALRDYAEQASNGGATGRRLFADDASQGFAFIDLCFKRYDAVLMNPPFGAFAMNVKGYVNHKYPRTKNDIYAAFVERGLEYLSIQGYLGAITSRTGFFLGSFRQWREKILLSEAQLLILADLGADVLDNAVVEVACYVLQNISTTSKLAYFFRILLDKDKETALFTSSTFQDQSRVFAVRPNSFKRVVSSPFAYWLDEPIRVSFQSFKKFEPSAGQVRCGLSTGGNPRFVRALWEISPENFFFCYYPLYGDENVCRFDDPIVQAYFSRYKKGTPIWALHVMAGVSQPWFSPITVAVNWYKDGRLLASTPGSSIRSPSYYFRPGFSWTRRAVRMMPYGIPSNAIPSASRYMAFPNPGLEYVAIGVVASNLASAYLRMFGEKFEWPNFLVDNLKSFPWTAKLEDLRSDFEKVVRAEVSSRREVYRGHEPFQEFTLPFGLSSNSKKVSIGFEYESLLEKYLERKVAAAYGFSEADQRSLDRDLLEAVSVRTNGKISTSSAELDDDNEDSEPTDLILDYSKRAEWESNLSYAIGCILGRWDMRIAIEQILAPKLQDPFDPLPVCPPGMLVAPDGLPANPNRIVSKEWLRARPNAITLPPGDAVRQPTIPDSQYPISIAWDGILVDDPGLDETKDLPHPADIVRGVRVALDVLWKYDTNSIEQEACEFLGVRNLREYFHRPGGFFADHLKRYSKSRRQAPIYLPLSTVSGSYTLWLYYHRLNSDMLFTAVNQYVSPKIADVEKRIGQIDAELASAAGRKATELRDTLGDLKNFLNELQDFKAELLRVAALPYKPNLNDGVIINAAPLYKLFRLRKWANDCAEVWRKLENEEYEWAHMAYTIWPDRVREVCVRDRSIAIAHDLEHLCEAPVSGTKRRKGRNQPGDDDEPEIVNMIL